MSAFSSRSAKILTVLVLISLLFLWEPWSGIEPGLRGVTLGTDVGSGTQMVFELQGSRVTIQVTPGSPENLIDNLSSALTTGLESYVELVDYNPTTGQATFDINIPLTTPVVQEAIGALGTVVNVTPYVENNEMEQAISTLEARIDPYDLNGTQFNSFGATQIIFESPAVHATDAEDMLGKQGNFEAIIDNQVVLTNDDVQTVSTASTESGYAYAPVFLENQGVQLLTSAVSGEVDVPIVIYLDRPSDAILLFDNAILENATNLYYDENSMEFYVTGVVGITSYSFYISVPAVPVTSEGISDTSLQYLENQVTSKTTVLLLGSQQDFSAQVLQQIPSSYQIDTVPIRGEETVEDWVLRAAGVQGAPLVTENMASGIVENYLIFPFIFTSSGVALQEAQVFQEAVDYPLDLPISFESETTVQPSLGTGFMGEFAVAVAVGVLLTLAMVYLAFSRMRIALAVVVFAFVDAILTLGAMVLFRLVFGLPAIAGVLFVVLTGLTQHTMITNEMMKGLQPQERASVGWRTSRAISMVRITMVATIAATALITYLGFGPIRVFGLVATLGMVVAVLLTRPVFARVVESILAGGGKTAAPKATKAYEKKR